MQSGLGERFRRAVANGTARTGADNLGFFVSCIVVCPSLPSNTSCKRKAIGWRVRDDETGKSSLVGMGREQKLFCDGLIGCRHNRQVTSVAAALHTAFSTF